MEKRLGLVMAACVASLVGSVQAGVVYVDFAGGADTYADVTEQYNTYTNATTQVLVDEVGAASGITLAVAQYGRVHTSMSQLRLVTRLQELVPI